MITIYGIKNCNTIKKALGWLKMKNIAYEFHDYKKQGISKEKLKIWVQQVGWENLLNKKGTTWRNINEEWKASITNENAAVDLLAQETSAIKRPVLEKDQQKVLAVGFSGELWESLDW